MQDSIEKTIELAAPVERVWRAITDHREFGTWFRVDLEGPFVAGQTTGGVVTYPGYEGPKWEAEVQAIEPMHLFSFRWIPYADDADFDYSDSPRTLVEFRLEPTATGTRLVVCESGFAALPDARQRIDALRMNTQGWNKQAEHIKAHVES